MTMKNMRIFFRLAWRYPLLSKIPDFGGGMLLIGSLFGALAIYAKLNALDLSAGWNAFDPIFFAWEAWRLGGGKWSAQLSMDVFSIACVAWLMFRPLTEDEKKQREVFWTQGAYLRMGPLFAGVAFALYGVISAASLCTRLDRWGQGRGSSLGRQFGARLAALALGSLIAAFAGFYALFSGMAVGLAVVYPALWLSGASRWADCSPWIAQAIAFGLAMLLRHGYFGEVQKIFAGWWRKEGLEAFKREARLAFGAGSKRPRALLAQGWSRARSGVDSLAKSASDAWHAAREGLVEEGRKNGVLAEAERAELEREIGVCPARENAPSQSKRL